MRFRYALRTTFLFAAIAVLMLSIEGAKAQPVARRIATALCNTPQGPFCNAAMGPISGWNGHLFRLSQHYPLAPVPDVEPWRLFDPKTQAMAYLRTLLDYFFDGNLRDIESSFDPQLNSKRSWYNAPYQDQGLNGREFIHGLTRERVSRPGELDPHQTKPWNNYAVGFYNAPGGYVIGRVWANHGSPDPAAAKMIEGTVAAKLLFTTAPIAEVPYLQGAPEWDAYVYTDVNNPTPAPGSARSVIRVRLLQIDIAVKDSRVSDTTGWVFGTFVYGGGPGGSSGSGWQNVAPVGIMWGNDPGYSDGGPLTQTLLNPAVHMPHVGFQGRLNGPVDNALSSCLSCHSTAETPPGTMVPPTGVDPAPWFRNIPAGSPFDVGRQSLDYSLQLMVGIDNFQAKKVVIQTTDAVRRQAIIRSLQIRGSVRPPRDGGTTQ